MIFKSIDIIGSVKYTYKNKKEGMSSHKYE